MMKSEPLLIIVDPTADRHPAVERGMLLARELGMQAELFVCDYKSQLVGDTLLSPERQKNAKTSYLNDRKKFLEELARPYREQGLDVIAKVAWDRPLHEGILRQVLESNARLVVKDTHYHSLLKRTLLTNTDWQLLLNCPSPLWLVRADRQFAAQPKILVAVDPFNEHDKPANLDTRLVAEAFEIGDALAGQVHLTHVFNAYREPDDPDLIERRHAEALSELAGKLQVPEDRTHLHAGNPVDLLPKIASDLDADVVVMGAIARSRLENAFIGSTAEKVLDRLDCDVLAIKPKGFVCPAAFKSAPRGAILAD
jgi:universal stress protein E